MKCIKDLLLKVVPMEGEDGELMPSLHTQQDIEKFAELIVEECVDAVNSSGGDNTEYHITAIEKQFGEKDE